MNTKVDLLKEAIENGSKNQTMIVLDNLIENVNEDIALHITDPATITKLHEMLVEHLGVNPQAMKLKQRVPNRMRRAILFLRAMRNGVDRVAD